MRMKKRKFQTFVIQASHEQCITNIMEHLRYWPYVKAFASQGSRAIKVRVCIGQVSNQQQYYVDRSIMLIRLCLRQYHVRVWTTHRGWRFYRYYQDSLFLRPDHLLRDFKTFIDEMDQ